MKVKILKKIGSTASGNWINQYVGEVFEVKDVEKTPYSPNRDALQWVRADGVLKYFWKSWVKEGVIEIMFEPENGMVFEDKNGRHGIFIAINGTIGALYRNIDGVFSTYDCEDSIRNNLKTGYYKKIWKATSIYDLTRSGIHALTGRDPVWQYTPPIKELTLQEVADKFGIPVEQLRIKD